MQCASEAGCPFQTEQNMRPVRFRSELRDGMRVRSLESIYDHYSMDVRLTSLSSRGRTVKEATRSRPPGAGGRQGDGFKITADGVARLLNYSSSLRLLYRDTTRPSGQHPTCDRTVAAS